MAFYQNQLVREVNDEGEKQKRLARMLEIEDEVYQTAAGILQANLDFYLVTPDQEDPPPEWVERYGLAAAKNRLAVAKAGWLPPSQEPAAIRRSAQVVTGISRSRRHAANSAGPREVNAKIALPAPTAAGMPGAPVYPSKEVE